VSSRLGAFLDGEPLAEADARALWERFSAYMDAHKGDLHGFAAAEGYASVRPETRSGQAVLVLSRTAPQAPYGQTPVSRSAGSGGGSAGAQPGASRQGGGGGTPGGDPRKRRRR
jgi:hypothetical protein